MFTAFWIIPTDPSFNYRSETDIAEILGGVPTTIFMTYHPLLTEKGNQSIPVTIITQLAQS
jgi:hypothetical protein